MSGRRGSNSRQPAWKAGALPTELLPHFGGANINNKFIDLQVFFNKNLFFFVSNSFQGVNGFILKLLSIFYFKN